MKNKQEASGYSLNEFNPEFLKVQSELNKKESEVLMLQEKLDLLEASVNELQVKKAQSLSANPDTKPKLQKQVSDYNS